MLIFCPFLTFCCPFLHFFWKIAACMSLLSRIRPGNTNDCIVDYNHFVNLMAKLIKTKQSWHNWEDCIIIFGLQKWYTFLLKLLNIPPPPPNAMEVYVLWWEVPHSTLFLCYCRNLIPHFKANEILLTWILDKWHYFRNQ